GPRAGGFAGGGKEGAVAAQNEDGVDARNERFKREAGAHAAHALAETSLQRDAQAAVANLADERGEQSPRPFLLPVPHDSDPAGWERHAFVPTGANDSGCGRGSSLSQRSISRAIDSASSPAWRRSESRVPWSKKRSGTPKQRTRIAGPPLLARSSSTASPNPPGSAPSSSVTIRPVRRAQCTMRRSSSGFANRALITPALIPLSASFLAAERAGSTMVPYATSTMSPPGSRSSASPIGR